MKNIFLAFLFLLASAALHAQQPPKAPDDQTLLWRISGNGLEKPSYLFGTMHLICGAEIELSDSLKGAIRRADEIYLELDMENLQELMGLMNRMKMNGDTSLSDLLAPAQYDSVRRFFRERPASIPFTVLERFKPLLAATALMESDRECANPTGMEQLILSEAKKQKRPLYGLETMAFQMSIFDSIPYSLQANQLMEYVRNNGKEQGKKDYDELLQAYINQRLDQLESMTRHESPAMQPYLDLMLYRRNETWSAKLKKILPGKSVVVAVGAGHIAGERGLINLLRKAGFTVEPVANNMLKKWERTL